MSILSGLTGFAGTPNRLDLQDSGVPVAFWRGLGIDSSGRLCCEAFTAATTRYKEGFVFSANSLICYEIGGTIHHYIAGIPCTEIGAIAIEALDATSFVQSVGLTSSGRVAYV